ncbi:hypothetical protein GCM10023317_84650 [Actinopolymorpha pittospori]
MLSAAAEGAGVSPMLATPVLAGCSAAQPTDIRATAIRAAAQDPVRRNGTARLGPAVAVRMAGRWFMETPFAVSG